MILEEKKKVKMYVVELHLLSAPQHNPFEVFSIDFNASIINLVKWYDSYGNHDLAIEMEAKQLDGQLDDHLVPNLNTKTILILKI